MNKAFVREPDDTGQRHCPRCGSLGIAVGRVTLEAQLTPAALAGIGAWAFFCPFPRCEVAYFDDFERTVEVAAFRHPVYPKDETAPLCACFGLTADAIEADVREGVVTRVREVVLKARTPEAQCQTCAPSGQSCVADVQRYYLKLRESAQGS